MRNAFAQELEELAANDPRVVLLSGDIGNRMFDSYKTRFPNRFYNCGVAEANMMGMAAGLALSGMRPVVYTIVPFVTTRCLEQIRVDVCYHQAPVVIAGVGGGLCYASLGATHHSCEDIAFLRMLPGMTVVCPADPLETRLALRAGVRHPGPVYLRLGKKGEPDCHTESPDFQLGQAIDLRQGTDVALLSTGNLLPIALECADQLTLHQISASVISMHTVKPLDAARINQLVQSGCCLVTIEEHSIHGGLGAAVLEYLNDNSQYGVRVLRIGTPDEFMHQVGDHDYARKKWGLEAMQIVPRIRHFLAEEGIAQP